MGNKCNKRSPRLVPGELHSITERVNRSICLVVFFRETQQDAHRVCAEGSLTRAWGWGPAVWQAQTLQGRQAGCRLRRDPYVAILRPR